MAYGCFNLLLPNFYAVGYLFTYLLPSSVIPLFLAFANFQIRSFVIFKIYYIIYNLRHSKHLLLVCGLSLNPTYRLLLLYSNRSFFPITVCTFV